MDQYDRLFEELTLERVTLGAPHPHWLYYFPPRTVGRLAYKYVNKEGKMHRIFGPAFVNTAYGIEEWYKDGKLHRIGGPAKTHKGSFWWCKEGLLHRLGGPAVDTQMGPKQYWIEGVKYSPKEYKKEIARRIRKGLKYVD